MPVTEFHYKLNPEKMIKRFSFRLVLIFLCGAIILSCSTTRFTRKEKNDIIAKINGQEIFLEKLEEKIEKLGYFTTSPEEDLEKKTKALNELIIDVLIHQKAQVVDMSEDTSFQRYLAERMGDYLLDLLFEDEIAEEITVTPEEIENYYQDHPDDFYWIPDKAKASRILIKIDALPGSADYPQEEQKALNRISQIRQRIINGEDFAELAKELSEDPLSAKKGGNIGLVRRDKLIPEFREFIFSANLNELSQPIRSPQGYNLLIVREIIKGEKRGLDQDARSLTREFLKEEKQKRKVAEYIKYLKGKNSFAFNNYALSSPSSLLSENPWVLIINQKDTIWYNSYYSLWESYKSRIDEDTIKLEHKKDLLLDAPLVINLLLRQEAEEKGYSSLPEYQEKKRNYIISAGEQKIRAELEEEMTKSKPTEEEVYQYYLAHRESYPADSSLHVYHILFRDSLSAEKVREKIIKGADFVEMAEKHHHPMESKDDSSYDLGFISDQKISGEFYKAASILKVGEISPPVKTKYGYHLIKLVERERGLLDTYKAGIRRKLVKQKAKQIKENWEKKLRAESDIWVDEDLLERVKLREKQKD
jgi:parvulin-like peptidyl-prolyl isomerase